MQEEMTAFLKEWTNMIQLETKNMTSGTSSVHDTPAQASEVHMIEPNNVGYKQCISYY